VVFRVSKQGNKKRGNKMVKGRTKKTLPTADYEVMMNGDDNYRGWMVVPWLIVEGEKELSWMEE